MKKKSKKSQVKKKDTKSLRFLIGVLREDVCALGDQFSKLPDLVEQYLGICAQLRDVYTAVAKLVNAGAQGGAASKAAYPELTCWSCGYKYPTETLKPVITVGGLRIAQCCPTCIESYVMDGGKARDLNPLNPEKGKPLPLTPDQEAQAFGDNLRGKTELPVNTVCSLCSGPIYAGVEHKCRFKSTGLSFGEAMKAVVEGKKVRRCCWYKSCRVLLQPEYSQLLRITRTDGTETNYEIISSDVLATDWEIVT
jgi:hypothetical protein